MKAKETPTELTLNPQALIQTAMEKGAGIEVLERLVALRKEVTAEHAREAWHAAMAGFQKSCPSISRDREAKVRTRTGASYSYKYSSLGSMLKVALPHMSQQGLTVTWQQKISENSVGVNCRIAHELGHFEESGWVFMPIDRGTGSSAAQQVGSALTYARRYSFQGIAGLAPDDDDDAQCVPSPVGSASRAANPASENPAPAPEPSGPVQVGEDPAIAKMKARLANAGKNLASEKAQPTPAPAPAPAPAPSEEPTILMITEQQRKKIYATVRSVFTKIKKVDGVEKPDQKASNLAYHEWLQKAFKVTSTKDLSLEEANEVIAELEKLQQIPEKGSDDDAPF